MKKLRFVLSIALSFTLLVGMLLIKDVPAQAAVNTTSTYVALGDSITTGYGLANFKINDINNKESPSNFVNKLSKKLGEKAINFGVEGVDTTLFLQALVKPTTSEQKAAIVEIKKASVITISIGGNNMFFPILDALNVRIGNGKNIFNASTQEIQLAALSLFFDKKGIDKLKTDVLAGTLRFNGDANNKKVGDFVRIISTLKRMNPKAQIIVQTIYNPYKNKLLGIFDDAILSMNKEIIKGSENGKNYKVADVYSAFLKVKPCTALVNADVGMSFDPHPTAKGHEVIYTTVAYAAQNNTLPYNVKTVIRNGKLTTKITDGELILTVVPTKGYKVPKSISLTIGKGTKTTLLLINGKAAVPVVEVNTDILVTGICSK